MMNTLTWTVQLVRGEPGKPAAITTQEFPTKREALAFLRTTPYSFIRRQGRTYTIYPKVKR